MNNSKRFGYLKLFSLFSHLKDDELLDITHMLEDELAPKGTNIINQGDAGDRIYFILEGIAEAYTFNKQGQEVALEILSAGDYFGELALLTHGVRNCSVRAKTRCKLMSLSSDNFAKLLALHPSLKDELIQLLSKRLGITLHLISENQENIIIIMICSEEAANRIHHFEHYFKRIAPKSVVILEDNGSQNELAEKMNSIENSYVLIKTKASPSNFLVDRADHIINFVMNEANCFCLTPDASLWKIENTARRITNKTIGIALCSGGVPAAAHIGVLNVLQEEAIPLDYIVGTSAGAAIGGCFALNGSTEKILQQHLYLMNQSRLGMFLFALTHISFHFSGIFRNSIFKKINKPIFEDKKIEEAIIPFAVVASDLFTGKTVVIDEGSALDAITTSNSAVVFYEPDRRGEQMLIDGVATQPLPVQVLIDKGIDIKIAVPISQLDLLAPMKFNSKLPSIYMRSRSMMAEQIVNESLFLADAIIRPDVEGIHMDDLKKIQFAIQAGETAARLAIKQIRYLLYGHYNSIK